jgi:hypothetical protein
MCLNIAFRSLRFEVFHIPLPIPSSIKGAVEPGLNSAAPESADVSDVDAIGRNFWLLLWLNQDFCALCDFVFRSFATLIISPV